MRVLRRTLVAVALAAAVAWPAPSQAQTATASPPAAQTSTTPAQPQKGFNPDTSVIGNFVALAGKNPFNTEPTLALTEAEVSFQAVVDAYAKADFFLAASPEGVEVEEGYITFTSLPANLLLKAGKLRAEFGKVNRAHTHQMPTADRPLVTENLVGGEEGISESGLSLSYLVQNPALFVDVTSEVFAANSENFGTTRRSRLIYLGRVRAYRDLTEDKNIDLGFSLASGPTDTAALGPGGFAPDGTPLESGRRLIGLDATFRYRPLRRAIYRGLNVRTELIWSRQTLPGGEPVTAFGVYGLGEYQFARRWYLGGRVDRSARILDADAVDAGGSVFVTFWPTEFSQIRGQYRHTRYAEGVRGHEVFVQLNFSIGAHGAHIF